MTQGDGDGRGSLPEAAAEDFVDLVGALRRWQLPEPTWSRVEEALTRVRAALDLGDADGFRRAVDDLEGFSPPRSTRIGEQPTVPAPDRVRELGNELVHCVEGRPEPTDADADRLR